MPDISEGPDETLMQTLLKKGWGVDEWERFWCHWHGRKLAKMNLRLGRQCVACNCNGKFAEVGHG